MNHNLSLYDFSTKTIGDLFFSSLKQKLYTDLHIILHIVYKLT